MIIFLLIGCVLMSGAYMYIESVIYGLEKRKWTLAAILLGPLLLPMFQISKHMALRKSMGYHNAFLQA